MVIEPLEEALFDWLAGFELFLFFSSFFSFIFLQLCFFSFRYCLFCVVLLFVHLFDSLTVHILSLSLSLFISLSLFLSPLSCLGFGVIVSGHWVVVLRQWPDAARHLVVSVLDSQAFG